MTAVVYTGVGGPEVITRLQVPRPVLSGQDLLVRVHAAGLNRGDLLQRSGAYQVPEGGSPVPGIEVAGTIQSCGDQVTGFKAGDAVFGVVDGGGFADFCLLDCGMANRVPVGWTFAEAAATAESWLTAAEALFTLGGLEAGKSVLLHAGGSSTAITMLQAAKLIGATAYLTVRSRWKVEALRQLGADAVLWYDPGAVADRLAELTAGRGVDLVVDFVGEPRLAGNLAALRDGGILVVAGLLAGPEPAQLDLATVMTRRLQIKGLSLRRRPLTEKREVNRRFRDHWLDQLVRADVRPVIHAEYPVVDLAQAQAEMAQNRNLGKIVLRLSGDETS